MDYQARRLLVCLRYGIGDVVMELPVLETLRRALPKARITALGAEPATELLQGHAAVDEVVSVNRWGIRHRWYRGSGESARAIAGWLDERGFDLFLDVHHAPPAFGAVVESRGGPTLESDERVEREAAAAGENGTEAIRAAVEAGWGLSSPRWSVPQMTVPQEDRAFARDYLRPLD